MPNIKELYARNIKKREKKEQKHKLKLVTQEQKNQKNDKKQDIYAKQYTNKKNAKMNILINKIQKKYDKKIQMMQEKLNLLPEELKNEELKKLESSKFIKYYNFRIARIKKLYAKKAEKLKYKLSIGKITKEDFDENIYNLSIDEGSEYERWDKAISHKKVLTTEKKLLLKKESYENRRANAIEAIEIRKKSLAPSNRFQAFKDIKANFKARSIAGYELGDIFNKISSHIRKYSMFYILAIILLLFANGTHGDILKAQSFMTIINGNTYIIIIGLAMLLVIVAGYIDLSVGSLVGFIGAMSVIIYNQVGNIFVTLLLVILLGMVIGFVQGVLIGYFKMPAFIVTLGTMLLFQGLILTVTQSMTMIINSDISGNSSYVELITGAIPDISFGDFHIFGFLIVLFLGIVASLFMWTGRSKKAKYGLSIGSTFSFMLKQSFIIALFAILGFYVGSSIFGLQYYLIYIMVLIVMFIFVTQNTSFGRKVYAIGGNKRAATLSGINTARTTVYIFMIVGAMVGFASIVFTAIASNAAPDVSTRGYELDIISSVFVGGASMSGGIGTIPGTVIGGLILGYINVGMYQMNFQADMQKIIKALVLLGAVGYDIYSNRKIG